MYVFCVLCPLPFVCGGGLWSDVDNERSAQWAPHVLCDNGVCGERPRRQKSARFMVFIKKTPGFLDPAQK